MTALQQLPDLQAIDLPDPATVREGFVALLSTQSLMMFSGADAVGFLHRQLTNDVEHLREPEVRHAGYCTPQGRLLASFLIWKTGEQVWLQVSRDLQPSVQKRLQLFVLRDKVKITDASETWAQIGLGGAAASKVLTSWFEALPTHPYAKVDHQHGTLMRLADAFGSPRYLWIAPTEALATILPALSASLTRVTDRTWNLANIEAGVPNITAPTQEKFVAQMVNFDLIGGVNFKKGCYPGQEIIARTQYLGKVRRRMLRAAIALKNGEAVSGTDVYASNDPSQPCGMIVNAEPRTPDEVACLVSLRLPITEGATVTLGSADGSLLRFEPLPYSLPEDGEPS